MKKNITSLFSAKNLALALFFSAPMAATAQILMSQDFSTTGAISSTYVGTGANQFDFIGVNPSGMSSVYGTGGATGRLVFQRNSNNLAFAKTTDFTPTASPDLLKIKFKLAVSFGAAMTTGTAGVFYVGSGLVAAANTTGETASNRHSQFGVRIATGGFYLRDMGLFTDSPTYTGEQVVTWYINNSGVTINYNDPSGSSTALDNDKSHVWVGTTRVDFTNPTTMAVNNTIQATTASQTLKNFKFLFNNANGNSAIAIDDLEISTGNNVVIPVTLSSFKAKKMEAANQLTWTTETEINNKGYDVQRQTSNGSWEALGFVKGTGLPSTYSFEDKTPLSISYYRLRQMDFDGKETLSKVVSVAQSQKGQVRVSPNPASDKVNISLSNNDGFEATIITVYDLLGKQVLTQKTTANTVELDMSSLAKGTYLLKINANNSVYTEKITRQ